MFYRYMIYFSKEEIEQDAKTYPIVKYACLWRFVLQARQQSHDHKEEWLQES